MGIGFVLSHVQVVGGHLAETSVTLFALLRSPVGKICLNLLLVVHEGQVNFDGLGGSTLRAAVVEGTAEPLLHHFLCSFFTSDYFNFLVVNFNRHSSGTDNRLVSMFAHAHPSSIWHFHHR